MFSILWFANKICVPILAFLLWTSLMLMINAKSNLIIYVSVSWIIYFMSIAYLSQSNLTINIAYFTIMCIYHKIKIDSANNAIEKAINNKKRFKLTPRIIPLLRTLNDIYDEISHHNKFWCKYVFVMYSLMITNICMMLYAAINIEILMANIILNYTAIILSSALTFIIIPASVINRSSILTYKLLNKLYINTKFVSWTVKYKVNLIFIHFTL